MNQKLLVRTLILICQHFQKNVSLYNLRMKTPLSHLKKKVCISIGQSLRSSNNKSNIENTENNMPSKYIFQDFKI